MGSLSGGPFTAEGELTHSRAWSTMKVPVVVASINAGRADPLDVEAAITRSDNEAALRLFDALDDGPAEVEAVLRRAGDEETTLEREPDPRGWSPFGRTVWSLRAAAGFYRALARGELLSPDETERTLGAMTRIVPEQRWGLGELPDVPFKGGWGPAEDGGYDAIQIGVVDGRVLALAARAADFDGATRLLSRVAADLVRRHPG